MSVKKLFTVAIALCIACAFTATGCKRCKPQTIDENALRTPIAPSSSIGIKLMVDFQAGGLQPEKGASCLNFLNPVASAVNPKAASRHVNKSFSDVKFVAIRKFIQAGFKVKALESIYLPLSDTEDELGKAILDAIQSRTKNKAEFAELVQEYLKTQQQISLGVEEEVIKKKELTRLKNTLGLDYSLFLDLRPNQRIYNAMAVDLGSYEIIYSHRYLPVPPEKPANPFSKEVVLDYSTLDYALNHIVATLQRKRTPEPKPEVCEPY